MEYKYKRSSFDNTYLLINQTSLILHNGVGKYVHILVTSLSLNNFFSSINLCFTENLI